MTSALNRLARLGFVVAAVNEETGEYLYALTGRGLAYLEICEDPDSDSDLVDESVAALLRRLLSQGMNASQN